jgi:hypothetical protein
VWGMMIVAWTRREGADRFFAEQAIFGGKERLSKRGDHGPMVQQQVEHRKAGRGHGLDTGRNR